MVGPLKRLFSSKSRRARKEAKQAQATQSRQDPAAAGDTGYVGGLSAEHVSTAPLPVRSPLCMPQTGADAWQVTASHLLNHTAAQQHSCAPGRRCSLLPCIYLELVQLCNQPAHMYSWGPANGHLVTVSGTGFMPCTIDTQLA